VVLSFRAIQGHPDKASIVMSKFVPKRFALLLSCVVVLFSPGAAFAQTSPLYVNREYRFQIIFPGEPTARDTTHTTSSGASMPAREFFFEQGTDRYSVTVVNFPEGPEIDEQRMDHAASQLRQRGEIRFQFADNYDPGVPGRQFNIVEPDGRQLRASVYMWDHNLYITEVSAAPASLPALQFEQSITMLDAAGNEVNTGVGR
jgi:hypothetical protein